MSILSITLSAAVLVIGIAGSAHASNPAAGEKVFKKCASCPQIGEAAKNRTGPVLNGLVRRPVGQAADFKYSDAKAASGLTWDEPTLTVYLKEPKDLVTGTKMSFAGRKDDAEIANVIAYLATFAADRTRQ